MERMMHRYTHNYPSDISREQYALIKEELEYTRGVTRPREYDLYDVVCAILYLVKSGCQWRMLPVNFPPRGTVRYYYDIWAKATTVEGSLLSKVLKKIGGNDTKRRLPQK